MFCLFPLWPKVIRKGSQWLATVAVGFLVAVIVVGIFKYLLFSLLYILSARKLRSVGLRKKHKMITKMISGFGFCQILPRTLDSSNHSGLCMSTPTPESILVMLLRTMKSRRSHKSAMIATATRVGSLDLNL